MAFPSASGHTNLPNGNFSPTIFSQKALMEFRKASIAEDITNTDYSGEISDFGDSVKIMLEPDISVFPYQRGTTVQAQDLQDEDITLVIDQANYFAFKVDDIEKKHSHLNWEDLASNRAAYKLKDAFDQDILSVMALGAAAANVVDLGTTAAAVRISQEDGAFTPLSVMARMSRYLDEQNVPTDNRFFVADPVFWEQMSQENNKLLDAGVTGDSASPLRNGKVTSGLIRGFSCYQSNNLPKGGDGPDATAGVSDYGTLLAGHMSSTATASQINKTESFRDPDSFADVVRGMHLYGRKVLRNEALTVARYATR